MVDQWIVVERLDGLPVLPFHDNKFRFHARIDCVPFLGDVVYGSFQRAAGAQLVGVILPPKISEHPGAGPVPGTDHNAVEVR